MLFSTKSLLEFIRLVFNAIILVNYGWDVNKVDMSLMRQLSAVTIVICYFRIFYWLRIYPKFSLVIRVLFSALKNVLGSFMVLFAIILLTFGNASYVIEVNLQEEAA